MRIAITTGVLRVPPTYFVTEHAQRMSSQFDFRAFALAADLKDPSIEVEVVEALGFKKLPFGRRMNLAPLALARLAPMVCDFDPALVHQHFATWSTPAVAAAGKLRVPLLTTVHGYDVALPSGGSPLNAWHRRSVAAARKASARVLAVSRYLADEAIGAGFDASRLSVHYQGVDTDFFTPIERAPRSELPRVLFVGALSELKGVRDLIEASRRIATNTDHELLIVGDGPLRAELEEITSAEPHIKFAGGLSKEEVRDAMRSSTVFVLPTKEHGGRREAAGLVLLEAQACGLPVIAYASGGTPEMLEDGTTGVLVPERDIDSLVGAVRDAITMSPSSEAVVRAAARQFVVSHRSLALSCSELADHYNSLAG